MNKARMRIIFRSGFFAVRFASQAPPQALLATLSVLPAKQSLGQKGNLSQEIGGKKR
jgi:hypothetical protein